MRTNYETPAEYAKKALEITEQTPAVGARRPEHFKEVMRKTAGHYPSLDLMARQRTEWNEKIRSLLLLATVSLRGILNMQVIPRKYSLK